MTRMKHIVELELPHYLGYCRTRERKRGKEKGRNGVKNKGKEERDNTDRNGRRKKWVKNET